MAKVYTGSILTVNADDQIASCLVEDRGKIVFVGNSVPGLYRDAERIDLGEGALIPAFADTHQHLASFAIIHGGLNVMDAESNAEMLDLIRSYAASCSEPTLIAFGASPYSVREHRLISREELDSVCPDRPFYMVKYDGHACVVNTPLLHQIEEKVSSLRGFHPESGEMNQEAYFAVSDFITGSVKIPDLVRKMQKAIDFEASRGIGMVHTVSGVGFTMDLDITMETWFARSIQRGFQIRVFPQSLSVRAATSRRLPRIGGCFACALDGCFGSQDAAMLEPYSNDPNNSGVLYYSDEKVFEFCRAANRKGLQIELHAIGDAAFDQACRAIRAALDDHPREDHRHGIIHACLPTPTGMEICRDYRIQLPMQIAFDNWRQEPHEYTELLLGKERDARLNPVRSFQDAGCLVSFGSDAPCTTPDPVDWLYRAVHHSNPDESVSIRQALRMATYNGYCATFDENERGSLEAGKVADMVVLSRNPYEIPADEIRSIQVLHTILGGKEYIPQKQSVAGCMLRGMGSRRKA